MVILEQSWAGAAAPNLLWHVEGTLHPAAATVGLRLTPSTPCHFLYRVFGFGVIPAVFTLDDKVE